MQGGSVSGPGRAEEGVDQTQKSGWTVRDLQQILSFLPGLADLHGAVWTCTNELAGSDLSSPIGEAGALHEARVKYPLIPSRSPTCSLPVLNTVEAICAARCNSTN